MWYTLLEEYGLRITTHEKLCKVLIFFTWILIYNTLPKVYTIPSQKFIHYPFCLFKELSFCPFIIIIIFDAQSTLHSCEISVNHAKFHFSKPKTLLTIAFLIYFFIFLQKKDQKILMMIFQILIKQTCRKHCCSHLPFWKNFQKKLWNSCNIQIYFLL